MQAHYADITKQPDRDIHLLDLLLACFAERHKCIIFGSVISVHSLMECFLVIISDLPVYKFPLHVNICGKSKLTTGMMFLSDRRVYNVLLETILFPEVGKRKWKQTRLTSLIVLYPYTFYRSCPSTWPTLSLLLNVNLVDETLYEEGLFIMFMRAK